MQLYIWTKLLKEKTFKSYYFIILSFCFIYIFQKRICAIFKLKKRGGNLKSFQKQKFENYLVKGHNWGSGLWAEMDMMEGTWELDLKLMRYLVLKVGSLEGHALLHIKYGAHNPSAIAYGNNSVIITPCTVGVTLSNLRCCNRFALFKLRAKFVVKIKWF